MTEQNKKTIKVAKIKKAPAPAAPVVEEEDNDEEFQKLLNDFISAELSDADTGIEFEEKKAEKSAKKKKSKAEQIKEDSSIKEEEFINSLRKEEKTLYIAYAGFLDSLSSIVKKFNLKEPKFDFTAKMLFPNYKPSIGKIIAKDAVKGWDIIIQAYSKQISGLNPSASDNDILNFAEKCEDTTLTLALICYVETIVEIEGCEIVYQQRLLNYERKKVEKEIIREHQKRVERNKKYIKAIEKKRFPVDAERLVGNYFKTAGKDPEGAYKALTDNPAIFAPIELDRIKPRFFGLIKTKPQDGIKINKLLGKFLKKLRV